MPPNNRRTAVVAVAVAVGLFPPRDIFLRGDVQNITAHAGKSFLVDAPTVAEKSVALASEI
jgi:hypothetical protein